MRGGMLMRQLMRLSLPALLLAAGLCVLSGCLFIPTPAKTIEGKDVSEEVGKRGSKSPLQVGRSTRQDVLRVLGPPQMAAANGSRAAYTWRFSSGTYVWPLCFMAYGRVNARALVLEFDRAGVLRSFYTSKSDGNWYHNQVHGPPQLPEGMQYWGQLPAWPQTAPAAPADERRAEGER